MVNSEEGEGGKKGRQSEREEGRVNSQRGWEW